MLRATFLIIKVIDLNQEKRNIDLGSIDLIHCVTDIAVLQILILQVVMDIMIAPSLVLKNELHQREKVESIQTTLVTKEVDLLQDIQVVTRTGISLMMVERIEGLGTEKNILAKGIIEPVKRHISCQEIFNGLDSKVQAFAQSCMASANSRIV